MEKSKKEEAMEKFKLDIDKKGDKYLKNFLKELKENNVHFKLERSK